MTTALKAATLSLLLVVAVAPVLADNIVLYSNGPVDGTIDGWAINFGGSVTDSFTLSQASTVTGVQFDLWAFPGDMLQSIEWSIGTAQFASDSGTGSSSVSQGFLFSNSYGYDIDQDNFTLASPVVLSAGTYYLTLQNGDGSNGDPFYWDENDGPSLAFDSDLGSIGSESFSILSTPEPVLSGVLALFMVGLAYAVRRRSSQSDIKG